MAASCNKETVSTNVDNCTQLPTVATFKDETATVVWQPGDNPTVTVLRFANIIDKWPTYAICSLPKELQIDKLKIRCSGKTVKTSDECGPNVKGCNLNSVIVESYVILETPAKK